MHIGSNIKFLRKQHGWTQQDLAGQLDKTYITIGDYERGKALPPLNIIVILCKLFDVSIDTLVFRDVEKDGLPSPTEEDAESLATLRRLTQLQDQRLAELEREIREHAPGLARRLGLE
jgi:transcriptional regulator with XRE-family HTH domain